MKTMKFFIFAVLLISYFGCKQEKTGCPDSNALNFGVDAPCDYGELVLYGTKLQNIPYSVYVNNVKIGDITAVYPNGIGACNLPGTAYYLRSPTDKKVEWYSRKDFPNGSFLILRSGTETILGNCTRRAAD